MSQSRDGFPRMDDPALLARFAALPDHHQALVLFLILVAAAALGAALPSAASWRRARAWLGWKGQSPRALARAA
jgi:hypothetical protein